jgi:hypothetical protein
MKITKALCCLSFLTFSLLVAEDSAPDDFTLSWGTQRTTPQSVRDNDIKMQKQREVIRSVRAPQPQTCMGIESDNYLSANLGFGIDLVQTYTNSSVSNLSVYTNANVFYMGIQYGRNLGDRFGVHLSAGFTTGTFRFTGMGGFSLRFLDALSFSFLAGAMLGTGTTPVLAPGLLLDFDSFRIQASVLVSPSTMIIPTLGIAARF